QSAVGRGAPNQGGPDRGTFPTVACNRKVLTATGRPIGTDRSHASPLARNEEGLAILMRCPHYLAKPLQSRLPSLVKLVQLYPNLNRSVQRNACGSSAGYTHRSGSFQSSLLRDDLIEIQNQTGNH